MICGIGVDTVRVSVLSGLVAGMREGALGKMFTAYELAASREKREPDEYLATRYAAKEAVFKALGPALEQKLFDYRLVETRNREDGSPYIHVDDHLRSVMAQAGAARLHISITTEGDYATAFVVAEAPGGA